MKTLFWLARHGSTTDSGKGIFRGQRNSALDKSGFLDAHKQKEFFNKRKWQHVFCSDLTRAVETAKIIAEDHPDEEPKIITDLRPWDIGFLTGKSKEKFGDDMQGFIDNPNRVPKDGESEHEFENRIHPLFGEAMQIGITGLPCIVVAHSSLVHCLSHLLYGEDHDEMGVQPGGIVEVYLTDDNQFEAKPVLKSGHDDSSFETGKK